MLNAREYLTDPIYWPLAVAVWFGCATWCINCIDVTYSGVYAQVLELKRVIRKQKAEETKAS